jgi:uncharacterized LabA/DUF88 family protein
VANSMVKYLFVDGGYLRKFTGNIGRELFGGMSLSLDFAKIGAGFRKCFYYDCAAPQEKGESEADYKLRSSGQQGQFYNIRRVDGWHVFEGVLAGRGPSARQKQVDIQIAVDMLSHSYRRNMNELDFIAGDQDFKPLVDAIVREGMYVRLWYERTSVSRTLMNAADAKRPLSPYDIWAWSSAEFQTKRPLPSRSSGPGAPEGAVLERGRSSEGEVSLLKCATDYAISYEDNLNLGYTMQWRHPDREFLKLVFSHTVEQVEWQ